MVADRNEKFSRWFRYSPHALPWKRPPITSNLMPFNKMVDPTAGLPGNMFLQQFPPNHSYAPVVLIVFIVEPTPGVHRKPFESGYIRGATPKDLPIGGAVVTDRPECPRGSAPEKMVRKCLASARTAR